MDDLTAFLEARLNEDEEMARSGMSHPGRWVVRGVPGTDIGIPTGISCTAVLLEVEAKRRIIDEHTPGWRGFKRDVRCCMACAPHREDRAGVRDVYPCQTLRLLGLAYVAHSGYRQEWRP